MRVGIFLLSFLPFLVLASPYYSEYIENQSDKQFFVIFHGENVLPENEPKIKILERKYLEYEDGDYLEYKHLRIRIEKELNNLGVRVEVIENPDWRASIPNGS